MDEKYKEIKLLGLPVYESHGSSSNIFRELLNSCEPYREEEAYCNLYIFTSSAEAKKFADGKPVADLKYNVNLSKKGTQSCNALPLGWSASETLHFCIVTDKL